MQLAKYSTCLPPNPTGDKSSVTVPTVIIVSDSISFDEDRSIEMALHYMNLSIPFHHVNTMYTYCS